MKWGTLKQHWDKALGMRMYTLDYSEIAYGVFFSTWGCIQFDILGINIYISWCIHTYIYIYHDVYIYILYIYIHGIEYIYIYIHLYIYDTLYNQPHDGCRWNDGMR